MDFVFNKIADRKRRLFYRKQFLLTLKIFKFLFVLVDISSDIYYNTTAHFYNDVVFYLSIASLASLPIIIFLYAFFLYCYCFSKIESLKIKIIFPIFLIVFGPIISCFYPSLILLENYLPEDYRNISSVASLEYFYEALPQLLIQILNNNESNYWRTPTIISCTLSSISLFLGLIQLAKSKFNLDYLSYLNDIEQPAIENVKRRLNVLEINNIKEKFIKLKFYEIFDTDKLVLYLKFDLLLKHKYTEDNHNLVEDFLKEDFEVDNLRIVKSGLLARCCKPSGIYLFIKVIFVFAILTLNIVYIIIAEFEKEYKRFLLIFLLGWYYKHSISNLQVLERKLQIKYLALLRIFTITDFYNLVFILYNIEPKIRNPLKSEFKHYPFIGVIFIIFQIWNFYDTNTDSSLTIVVIAFNSLYLLMPIFRIIILCSNKNSRFYYY